MKQLSNASERFHPTTDKSPTVLRVHGGATGGIYRNDWRFRGTDAKSRATCRRIAVFSPLPTPPVLVDSLTQLTLGAAVGEAALGRKIGNKAPLWGAAFGTLPDLDVIVNPFVTELTALAFHRGLTHSLLFALVGAPIFAWLVHRIHRRSEASWRDWTVMIGLALLTHVALDCLTSYGTQVLYPFSDVRVALPSVFIIDPAYTLPLAGGLLWGIARHGARSRMRWRATMVGIAVSTAYLLFTLTVKVHVEQVFSNSLQEQGLPHTEVFTKATPFNSVLWSGIVSTDEGVWTGYYSILDADQSVSFQFTPRNAHLLDGHRDDPAVETIQWFSKGYYTVSRSGDTLFMHDLRFGRSDLGLTDEGSYLFTFRLQPNASGRYTGLHQLDPSVDTDGDLLRQFVDRIRGQENGSRSAS